MRARNRHGYRSADAQSLLVQKTVVPKFYCPIPAAINTHVATVHTLSRQWCCHMGLVTAGDKQYQRLNAAKFAWLAGLTQPSISAADLKLTADWYTWLFFHDDVCDVTVVGRDPHQLATITNRLFEILKGNTPTNQDPPLVRALYNICQRLTCRANSLWMQRFIDSVEQYFEGNLWEATNRQQSTTPDLATYTKMRLFTGGVTPCFHLIGVTQHIDPWSKFFEHPHVQQLITLANHHICWVNDIIGLEKEIKEGNMNNLVLVLQQEYQITLQEAIDRAVQMCNTKMERFLELEMNLPSYSKREEIDLQRFVNGLRFWMRGHLDWYARTGRYEVQLN